VTNEVSDVDCESVRRCVVGGENQRNRTDVSEIDLMLQWRY